GYPPFIVKYDASGGFKWANYATEVCPPSPSACAGSFVTGVGISFDPAGDVILSSFGDPVVGGGIDFGIGTFPTYSEPNIFLAAYSPNAGTLVWAKQVPTILSSILLGVATDSQGRVIVSGNYSGSMQVDGRLLVTAVPEQPGVVDSFLT